MAMSRASVTHASRLAAITATLTLVLAGAPLAEPLPDSPLWDLSRAALVGAAAVRTDTHDESGFRILPMESIVTWNSAIPRIEPEDGSLWSGRGLNTLVRGGLAYDSDLLSFVLQPEVTASQNLPFETVPSAVTRPNGGIGYYFGAIDYPQRPGDESFVTPGFGIARATVDTGPFFASVGHDRIRVGPAAFNPLLLSAGAPPFWQVRLGVKPIATALGAVGASGMWGILEESEYFDAIPENDQRFLSGIFLTWAPRRLPGFTLGVNRTVLSYLAETDFAVAMTLFNPVFTNRSYGYDRLDQKASLTVDWSFPEAGFRAYAELFWEDYISSIRNVMLVPQHAMAYTVGAVQRIDAVVPVVITGEASQLMQSRDYEIGLGVGGTYYQHGLVTQGHTHRGQVLGAGIGGGSDAQTLEVMALLERGEFMARIQRIGWHKDYIYRDPDDAASPDGPDLFRLNSEIGVGLEGRHRFAAGGWTVGAELFVSLNLNRGFVAENDVVNVFAAVTTTWRP